MAGLPITTRVGTALLVVAAAAAFILVAGEWDRSLSASQVIVALILGALIIFAEIFDISFPHAAGTFHVSVLSPIALAAGLTLGPFVGGMVVVIAVFIESIYARRELIKAVVNVANFGLATLLSAVVYGAMADLAMTPLGSFRNMAAVVAAGLVWTLSNASILSFIVAPIVGTSPVRMLRTNLSEIYVQMLMLPTFGAIVPVLAREHPLALLVLVIPLVGPLLAYKSFEQARQEIRQMTEGIADILERRDPYTHEHSVRVTDYVGAILQELPAVSFETAQGILAAARVHDLGKVAIRDQTLNKPGKLTPEEWIEIEGHAAIGADLVERLGIYRPWTGVVRHHHERWDGTGYPERLAGEAIPLGARIIAVADAFDAMTSDRPYRRALDRHFAVQELRKMSGSQFDPAVVDALGRSLRRLEAGAPPRPVSLTRPRDVPATPTA